MGYTGSQGFGQPSFSNHPFSLENHLFPTSEFQMEPSPGSSLRRGTACPDPRGYSDVSKDRLLMVNETQVQDFCWSYWGRGVLCLLSWWEVTLGLPAAARRYKGPQTRSQSSGKRRRKLNPAAGGPGSSRPKANPTRKTFQLSQQMLIFT